MKVFDALFRRGSNVVFAQKEKKRRFNCWSPRDSEIRMVKDYVVEGGLRLCLFVRVSGYLLILSVWVARSVGNSIS